MVIVVDGERYKFPNGLVDLKLYTLMKILGFVKEKIKIKHVIAMTEVFYEWTKKNAFTWTRNPHKIPPWQRVISVVSSIYQTVFLDVAMSKGIYQWTVKVMFHHFSCFIRLSIATPDILSACDHACTAKIDGCASFWFYRFDNTFRTQLEGVADRVPMSIEQTNFYDSEAQSVITAELDTGARTVRYFVEGLPFAHALSHIPIPVYLGVNIHDHNTSFETESFTRLLTPTPSDNSVLFHRYTGRN